MLNPQMILQAYTQGVFPMAHPEEDNAIYWHEPHQRGIIPLDHFRISKNLGRLVQRGKFECRINTAFREVMLGCAARQETWISDDIVEAYVQLHELGWAHSFESWLDGELVGGLYGLAIQRAFFGESMFHAVTDASKVALVHLVHFLRAKGFELLDCQFINDHLKQFGAIEIPQARYMQLLKKALA